MKAYKITQGAGIDQLPFVANLRKGDLPAESLRLQAAGEMPRATPPDLRPARFIRSIIVEDGLFASFASGPGALLTFVVSGSLTLTTNDSKNVTLMPGDIVLLDESSARGINAEAAGACRLIQLGVASDWPDSPDAKMQDEGTLTPRGEITLKRVVEGDDGLSYFHEFPELFSAPTGEWSVPRPIIGFRFMSWENGFFDWHPEVVNHLGIVLAGELIIEASGDRLSHSFRAGDIMLAEDRTGKGHSNRCNGKIYVALIQLETEDLW